MNECLTWHAPIPIQGQDMKNPQVYFWVIHQFYSYNNASVIDNKDMYYIIKERLYLHKHFYKCQIGT